MNHTNDLLRPSQLCKALMAALEAAEGRRQRRKRDQTADAIGLSVKRELLRCAVQDDPGPEQFEEWLLAYVRAREGGEFAGAALAMARSVQEEWRLAHTMSEFASWLARGAPSEDAVACTISGAP